MSKYNFLSRLCNFCVIICFQTAREFVILCSILECEKWRKKGVIVCGLKKKWAFYGCKLALHGSFEKQTISESTNIEEPQGIMGNGMHMNEVALEDLSA